MQLAMIASHGHYDWFLRALHDYGYLALFGFIGLQDLGIPTLVPGAVFLVFAGFLASRGVLNPFAAVIVASVGSVLGASVLFGLARMGGEAFFRYFGRFVHGDSERRGRLEHWLRRWGLPAWVLLRLVPGFRCALSVVSGFGGLPYPQFVLLSGTSALIWCSAFVALGYVLGPHWGKAVGIVLASGPIALIVVALVVAITIWRSVARGRSRRLCARS